MTASCGSESAKPDAVSCCGNSMIQLEPRPLRQIQVPWTHGVLPTAVGDVPRVRTRLGLRDLLGTLMVRSGFGRSRYRVPPGLYAAGSPTPTSPVLLSANYKLSFDHLRSVLGGRDAWILVLDTQGINVWCAAGKGTFTSFMLMNFTGASTYTSLSGVLREMRFAVPAQVSAAVVGLVLWLTGLFVPGGPAR